MRAVIVEKYGPPEVARVVELPAPEPRAGEVLVRVRATAVTSGDARMRAGRFPPGFDLPARLAIGLRGPRAHVLGVVFAGEVVACGSGVDTHAVGDRVAGMTGTGCGAHADFVRVRAARAQHLPEALSDDAAAAVLFGGSTAVDYLGSKARLAERVAERGGADLPTVLINGASGSVGSAAVQFARHLGARVTAVTSAANTDFALSLGADRTIDYRATPLPTLAEAGDRFDVILDTVGNLTPASGRTLLADGGVLLLAVASFGQTISARGNVKAGPASEKADDLGRVLRLAADGVLEPSIETTYPLEGIAEAYRRVDSGRKVGNIVLRPHATVG